MATPVEEARARTRGGTSAQPRPGAGRRRRLPLPLAALLALIPPALFLCFVLAAPQPARAAGPTFTVDSLLDEPDAAIPDEACRSAPSGRCTLRAAVEQAEWTGQATIILPAGTYVLTRGQLDIKVLIEIQGAGAAATIVDGNSNRPACSPAGTLSCRVFDMKNGSTLIASGLTIRGGTAGLGEAGHYHGGGIHNHGRLELRDVVVGGNHVVAAGWGGGGITTASNASALLERVTIHGNTAKVNGGGLENLGGLALINSTISGNSAEEKAGGVWHSGGAFSSISYATIAGNVAPAGGGGGLNRGGGTPLYVSKTILAGNAGGNCGGTPTSFEYNLSSDGSCPFANTGDRNATDPQLGPPQNNGGQLPTHKPAPTSPAINAIPLPCSGNDQRGVARPQGSGCDIGAVELDLDVIDGTPPHEEQPSRCFRETGFCIAGRFLQHWEANGGLALNGYPLTAERVETLEDGNQYTVQYFERVRLERHPENPPPNDVLLGQFGRRIHPADPPVPPPSGPITQDGFYFTETGHYVPGRFFAFWNANGGLRQFGYPISEAFEERLEDGRAYRVQYFERARFEYHPENAPPFDVLLGQFGRRILAEVDGGR